MQVDGLFNGGRTEGASGWVVQGMEVCGYTCPHKNVGSFLYTTLLSGCPRQRCGVHRVLFAHIAYRLSTAATVCDAASQFKSINFHLHHGTYLGGYTFH